MKSRNISTRDKGFTLIEILLVIGIIIFIGTLGIIVGVDSYTRSIFRSDIDKVVALLQKARSSSINNINEERYGVYFGDPANFVLFRGDNFDPSDIFNYEVERSKIATSTNTCIDDQVVFEQLTGNTTPCQIVITEGGKVATTTLNSQGGINY